MVDYNMQPMAVRSDYFGGFYEYAGYAWPVDVTVSDLDAPEKIGKGGVEP